MLQVMSGFVLAVFTQILIQHLTFSVSALRQAPVGLVGKSNQPLSSVPLLCHPVIMFYVVQDIQSFRCTSLLI